MGGSLYFWYTLQNYGEVSGVAISARWTPDRQSRPVLSHGLVHCVVFLSRKVTYSTPDPVGRSPIKLTQD